MNLIVLESRGHWAAALRRLLPTHALPLRETRAMADCDVELATAPTSFVVAELTVAGATRLIEQFAAWRDLRPRSSLAMVAARELMPWRGLALEAGATLIAFSPRKLADLVAAVQRHATRYPQPPGNAAERIWAELPLN